ncbi:HAD-IB family phosphatase [Patescibacteria group bacterium]|nr:HAD-IB family phosphatase [Patescibacteria group bacterium]
MKKKRPVAVFDVDGTIFRSSLFIELVEELIRQKHLPASMKKAYADEKEEWMNREGTYDAYVKAMVRASYEYFRGIDMVDFKRASRTVVETQSKHVYRFTRDLIKTLKKRDYFLLAVSHSPKVILDYFCPSLGFDKWYGLMYETDPKNKLTARVVDPHIILDKAAILKRAVTNQNLSYTKSIGVGDSETDVPFLKLVDEPICFNPASGLYKRAKKNGWRTVVERKDVIYEL